MFNCLYNYIHITYYLSIPCEQSAILCYHCMLILQTEIVQIVVFSSYVLPCIEYFGAQKIKPEYNHKCTLIQDSSEVFIHWFTKSLYKKKRISNELLKLTCGHNGRKSSIWRSDTMTLWHYFLINSLCYSDSSIDRRWVRNNEQVRKVIKISLLAPYREEWTQIYSCALCTRVLCVHSVFVVSSFN